MTRTEKTWKELPEGVDFNSGNWSWGRGGSPLSDWQYSISHYTAEFEEIRYALPDCISEMLRKSGEHGADEARREIRSALGVR